jgi:hypothetical protein
MVAAEANLVLRFLIDRERPNARRYHVVAEFRAMLVVASLHVAGPIMTLVTFVLVIVPSMPRRTCAALIAATIASASQPT